MMPKLIIGFKNKYIKKRNIKVYAKKTTRESTDGCVGMLVVLSGYEYTLVF